MPQLTLLWRLLQRRPCCLRPPPPLLLLLFGAVCLYPPDLLV
jgi:hypothetical protein